jgi:histidine triad (HIT) family protein
MATIFTKIINGEIPSYKVAEVEKFYAFLDINPTAAGHTLIVPKQEIDNVFDLDDETLSVMSVFAKRIAIALEKTMDCKRVGVLVVGTEVPHAHIHLIPFQKESQMSLASPKLKFSQEEMKNIAKKIIQNL